MLSRHELGRDAACAAAAAALLFSCGGKDTSAKPDADSAIVDGGEGGAMIDGAPHSDGREDAIADITFRDGTPDVSDVSDVSVDGGPLDGSSDGGSASCEDAGSYLACGCGCCGGEPAGGYTCYYPSRGENLAQIMGEDRQAAADPECAAAGCSIGMARVCCDDDPDEAGAAASYAGEYIIGGLDRIVIRKADASRDACLILVLVSPAATMPPGYSVDVPKSWGIESATRGPLQQCATGDGPTADAASTATGTARFRAGNDCTMDLDLTFEFDGDATAPTHRTERMAVHGVGVPGLGPCPTPPP